jgi:hypothetical protein
LSHGFREGGAHEETVLAVVYQQNGLSFAHKPAGSPSRSSSQKRLPWPAVDMPRPPILDSLLDGRPMRCSLIALRRVKSLKIWF